MSEAKPSQSLLITTETDSGQISTKKYNFFFFLLIGHFLFNLDT